MGVSAVHIRINKDGLNIDKMGGEAGEVSPNLAMEKLRVADASLEVLREFAADSALRSRLVPSILAGSPNMVKYNVPTDILNMDGEAAELYLYDLDGNNTNIELATLRFMHGGVLTIVEIESPEFLAGLNPYWTARFEKAPAVSEEVKKNNKVEKKVEKRPTNAELRHFEETVKRLGGSVKLSPVVSGMGL